MTAGATLLLLLDGGGGVISSGPIDATWIVPAGARTWGYSAMPNQLDAGNPIPHVSGSIENYAMDFGDCPQAAAGVAMGGVSLTIDPASGVTIAGTASVNGYLVRATFSGTVAVGNYTVTGTVNWADGTRTIRRAVLAVE